MHFRLITEGAHVCTDTHACMHLPPSSPASSGTALTSAWMRCLADEFGSWHLLYSTHVGMDLPSSHPSLHAPPLLHSRLRGPPLLSLKPAPPQLPSVTTHVCMDLLTHISMHAPALRHHSRLRGRDVDGRVDAVRTTGRHQCDGGQPAGWLQGGCRVAPRQWR